MKANRESDNMMREYLLGDLSEDAREQLEKRLMTDDEEFQRLLIEEDELVDDYVRDQLSESERLQFESHFLCTPERQRKLRFAGTLREFVRAYWKIGLKRTPQPKRAVKLRSLLARLFKLIPHPSPAWGAATGAFLLVVATGVWSTVGYMRIQGELDEVSAERTELIQERDDLQRQFAVERARAVERAQREAPPHVVNAPSMPRASTGRETISFTLLPGLLRGAGEFARVRVTSEANLVALHLDIGMDEYPRYRAVLHEAEGDEIWSQSKLKARIVSTGAMVVLTLPSQLLAPGDYYVKLDGVTEEGTTEGLGIYDFRVLRE